MKIVPELSYESKLLQTRYRRNRMFVLRGLREKRERERERKRRRKYELQLQIRVANYAEYRVKRDQVRVCLNPIGV